MSLSFVRQAAVCFCWALCLVMPVVVFGQTNYYTTNGIEYSVVGPLPGDQVWPDVALNSSGGYVVWQDNATDGSGWGISAQKLNGTLSGTLSPFRVNAQGANDQQNARVALLKNGGAVFVWQGGLEGFQHVYARFLNASNVFLTTTDLVVSVPTNNFQVNPDVAVLNNGNVVFVWSSFDEAASSSLLDVYAKILSPTGQTVSNEFLVNQFTTSNQRTPVVAALANGGFVVAWISEQERTAAPVLGTNSTYYTADSIVLPSVDVYARLYQSDGAPQGDEFRVDTGSDPCANPAVAAASDGSFMVAWSQHAMSNLTNGWDIYARPFSAEGAGGSALRLNTYTAGNQYAPHLSAIDQDYLAVWTSLNQDGSREGVYGRFVHSDGTLVGGEFRVNTTWIGQQMQPAVAADGANQFLAVWTSYTTATAGFDLFGQRYINVNMTTNLPPLDAPFVWAPFTVVNGAYQPQLEVSWATLPGIAVSNYQVYADGTNLPTAVVSGATNEWTMTAANGLTVSSTHWFQVAYSTVNGRQSPLSAATTNSTWSGLNYYGIPFEWMETYYGMSFSDWPSNVNAPLTPGGPTLLEVFLSGGNPKDPSTWLQTSLTRTAEGMYLNWNTQPGLTYQVEETTNLTAWFNVGNPRFAAGTNDSIYVGGHPAGYYRVLLQR